MEDQRKLTVEELSQFDGKDGRPSYVAYKGKVYDVSDSYQWIDGEHFGEHMAGKDLTQQMTSAPHGEDVMDGMKIVGVLLPS
ncbi:MAG: cytochrome b5 domain-containing protein [Candidatus Bathyarchaeia archaeon]